MSDKPSVKELRKTIDTIKKIIKDLDKKQIYGLENRENYFFENHTELVPKYQFLVSHLCSGDSNDMLEIMLRHLEEIEMGEKTNDEVDVVIGEKLASKFL